MTGSFRNSCDVLNFKSGQNCEILSSPVEGMAVQLSLTKLVRNVKLWPLIEPHPTLLSLVTLGGISGRQVVHKCKTMDNLGISIY